MREEIKPIDKRKKDIYIMYITFEWDDKKAKVNYAKHKVTFEEAQSVFYDENALLISDEKHSDNEERFILMGLSSMMNTLLVCYCERGSDDDEIIRIISSRKANKKENEQYWKRRSV
ncbi:MAG: BrnT family toxin [Fibrobacter sp.]|nr:BrnT family toxin [Fibrobacter sp.]